MSHSGALLVICEKFNCLTTNEVKKEVVDEGKKRLYPEVELVDELINKKILDVKNTKQKSIEILGKGESPILNLIKKLDNYIIVSDDNKFTNELARQGLDFLVPMDIIVLLKIKDKINSKEANDFLEKIKPFVREKEYKKAKEMIGG